VQSKAANEASRAKPQIGIVDDIGSVIGATPRGFENLAHIKGRNALAVKRKQLISKAKFSDDGKDLADIDGTSESTKKANTLITVRKGAVKPPMSSISTTLPSN